MKKKMFNCLFLSLLLIGVGCATKPVWKSEPNTRQVENEYFYATMSPIFMFDGYKGFLITILNKSASNIEVLWNKTFYLYNGERNGDFMLEGMRFSDRKKTKPHDIIVSGRLFSMEIFPSRLAELSSLAKAWIRDSMKPGENGIHLTVKVGQKEMTEKLTLNFSEK